MLPHPLHGVGGAVARHGQDVELEGGPVKVKLAGCVELLRAVVLDEEAGLPERGGAGEVGVHDEGAVAHGGDGAGGVAPGGLADAQRRAHPVAAREVLEAAAGRHRVDAGDGQRGGLLKEELGAALAGGVGRVQKVGEARGVVALARIQRAQRSGGWPKY